MGKTIQKKDIGKVVVNFPKSERKYVRLGLIPYGNFFMFENELFLVYYGGVISMLNYADMDFDVDMEVLPVNVTIDVNYV